MRSFFFFLLVSKCRHALWGLLPSFGDVTHARESLCCLSKQREPALMVPPSDSPMPDSHNTHARTPPAPILAEHARTRPTDAFNKGKTTHPVYKTIESVLVVQRVPHIPCAVFWLFVLCSSPRCVLYLVQVLVQVLFP